MRPELTGAERSRPERAPGQAGGPPRTFGELRPTMRWLGLVTWAALCAHAVLSLPAKPWRLTPDEVPPFAFCLLAFLAVFWTATSPASDRWPQRPRLLLCGLQAVLALTANQLFDGNSLLSGLLLVTMLQAGVLLPLRLALVWVAVQTLGLAGVLCFNWPLVDALPYTTGYLCFQVFTALSAQIAVREMRARQQLARVVQELRAARTLLEEAARDGERLRIARDLHDLLGHHLTALSMNLQVAGHTAQDEPTRRHVERAGSISRLLLHDVREAVRTIRQDQPLDLAGEIAAVQRCHPQVRLHLNSPQPVRAGAVQAQVLLRCVQEIVTNAVKHGAASAVWLDLTCADGALTLEARDNGSGSGGCGPGGREVGGQGAAPVPGCGLRGMRERLELLGGTLHLQPRPGPGFSLRATLPLAAPGDPASSAASLTATARLTGTAS